MKIVRRLSLLLYLVLHLVAVGMATAVSHVVS